MKRTWNFYLSFRRPPRWWPFHQAQRRNQMTSWEVLNKEDSGKGWKNGAWGRNNTPHSPVGASCFHTQFIDLPSKWHQVILLQAASILSCTALDGEGLILKSCRERNRLSYICANTGITLARGIVTCEFNSLVLSCMCESNNTELPK